MKSVIVLSALFLVSITSCKEDDVTMNLDFVAQVLGKGIDCGDTYLVKILNDSTEIYNVTGSYGRIYYANNLLEAHKRADLLLSIDIRKLKEEEQYPCSTLGIPYPHVFVIDSKPL